MRKFLREGSRGPEVVRLQRRLNREADTGLDDDGMFGANTEKAVRQYQRGHGLVADGVVGNKTWRTLIGETVVAIAPLAQTDIEAAAAQLNVEVPAMMAINEVESAGDGFIPGTIKPSILFERHVMYRRAKAAGYDVTSLQARLPAVINSKPGGYAGGMAEHTRLASAATIDEAIAQESASWGAFQIMGFHWERLGYTSIDAFVAAAHESEASQLGIFVRFMSADKALLAALRSLDWVDVARRYNGPGYARNDYDHRLAAAYRRHRGALAEA